MQKFWGNLAVQLGKRAGLVSIIGLIVTLVLGYGITKLEFATGQDSYLNKSDVVYKDNVRYQELFGGQAMLTLFTMDDGKRVEDLLTEKNQAQFKKVAAQLDASPEIISVISPLTSIEFSDRLVASPDGDPTKSISGQMLLRGAAEDPTAKGRALRTEDALKTVQRLSAVPVAERTLSNPEWVKFLLYDNTGGIRKSLQSFFPDPTHAQLVARVKGNSSIEEEGKASDFVVGLMGQQKWDNASTLTTGAPVLLKDINDYLRGGMLTLGAIAVLIMMVILLLLFDVRWRLLPLFVIVIGVIWAFGLAGYLGIPLSLVTIAGLPVMLGIGIDYAIQMHARVEEEVIIDREPHPIQETARNLGPALLVVTFDAIFAFAALYFAKVPMIRQFGLLLAVGIAVICFGSIIIPLAALGIREYKSPTKGRDFREGFLGRLVVRLGGLPVKLAPWLALASILIFFGGAVVEDKLVLQTDPVQWVNQSSQVITDLHTLEDETGSSSELGMFVESRDVFNDRTVDFVHDFTTTAFENYPDRLVTAGSIVSTMSYILELPGAGDVAPTGAEVEAAWKVAPRGVKVSTVGNDGTAMNIVFRTGPSTLEDALVVVDRIRAETNPPPGVTATPSGLVVVGTGLLKNLEANRILLTYLAIGFVFLFLSVRLRSVVRALLSLVPVLIAVGVASLVAYGLDLKLSPMTAVGGPLVVAACTEFTSLILLRFVEERRRGLTPKEAVDVAAARTGRAFIVSGLTAIAGVAVISLSSLPLLRDFGRVVGMNVAVALLSALVVLPPLLAWADKRNWVSKGLVSPEILEASAARAAAEAQGVEVPVIEQA